jgi:hypothetical protein
MEERFITEKYKGKNAIYNCYKMLKKDKLEEYADIEMFQIKFNFKNNEYGAVYGFKEEGNSVLFGIKIYNAQMEERFMIDNQIKKEYLVTTTFLKHVCSVIDEILGDKEWETDKYSWNVSFLKSQL